MKPSRTAADGLSRWKTEAERREVNEALDRGATWREVAGICARHGRRGVTSQNVSNYKKSGDRRRWLALRERLEVIRTESELTSAILRHYADEGGSPAEAGLLAASEILAGALSGFESQSLRDRLAIDPKAILGIVRELARIVAALGPKDPAAAPPNPAQAPAVSEAERAAIIASAVDKALGIHQQA